VVAPLASSRGTGRGARTHWGAASLSVASLPSLPLTLRPRPPHPTVPIAAIDVVCLPIPTAAPGPAPLPEESEDAILEGARLPATRIPLARLGDRLALPAAAAIFASVARLDLVEAGLVHPPCGCPAAARTAPRHRCEQRRAWQPTRCCC